MGMRNSGPRSQRPVEEEEVEEVRAEGRRTAHIKADRPTLNEHHCVLIKAQLEELSKLPPDVKNHRLSITF